MSTDSPNTPQQHFSDSIPQARTGPPIQEAHDSLALKAHCFGRWKMDLEALMLWDTQGRSLLWASVFSPEKSKRCST